jgi:hypothetical protein
MPIFASVFIALNEAGVPFREPLRARTEIEPGVMIAVMETVMQLVKSQPDFEARRLARKSAVKFRY